MSQTLHSKVLILGSGPAGYTAAIYAARANLSPRLVQGLTPGGQLAITTDVENYPGFADVIQGPWLMEQMKLQAESVGTEMHFDTIIKVDFSSKPYKCYGDSGNLYTADTVIICTGAKAKWLGLDSEKEFLGFGVSACATCDGFFYRDKTVAVVGGGNTAVEEALYLTNHAKKVYLIHRRDELRAEKILQERLLKNEKIEPIWHHVVEEIQGSDTPKSVEQVLLRNIQTDQPMTLSIDGIFIAIGHAPATSLFHDKLNMDKTGYILTAPDSTATNIPGVYAAGDVKDKVYRQAITAAGMGCMAALEAEAYIAEQDFNNNLSETKKYA